MHPSILTTRFFAELSGKKNLKKKSIFNLALLQFVQNHKLKRPPKYIPKAEQGNQYSLEYQPTTFETDLKTLFGVFKKHQIFYSMEDFKEDGTWLAWLKSHWAKVATARADFGALPMQATFDPQRDKKLKTALENGILEPEGNYEHLVMLILQLLGKIMMLRGGGEASEFLVLHCSVTIQIY